MTREEAQKRTTDIRNIRGCYALLRNTLGHVDEWMFPIHARSLQLAVEVLGGIVEYLDEIRSESAKIRAGVLCKTCKKLTFDGKPEDRCSCWSQAIAEDQAPRDAE